VQRFAPVAQASEFGGKTALKLPGKTFL